MGGLSRKLAYVNSLKENNIDPIIIDAGDALFTNTKLNNESDSMIQHKAEAFLEGYKKIGIEALNIGEFDLTAGYDFLKTIKQELDLPFISANLYEKATDKLAFDPYVIVKRNDLKVGIVGVTNHLSPDVSQLYKKDYIKSGQDALKRLKNKVDVLVMLVNADKINKNILLESFKDADYVYSSRTVMTPRLNQPQKFGYPIYFTSGINGKQLINTKATIIDGKKPIVEISSHNFRRITSKQQLKRLTKTENGQTVEDKYKDKPMVLDQIRRLEDFVKESENKIKDVVNTSETKIVAIPKKLPFDQEMQNFIDKSLAEVDKLK